MNAKEFAKSPGNLRYVIRIGKKWDQEYLEKFKDTKIPMFLEELRGLGLDVEVSNQVEIFLPEEKDLILPLIIKYYVEDKTGYDKSYFRRLLRFRGFDEAVPKLIEEYHLPETDSVASELIANSLYNIRSRKYTDEYIKIIKNKDDKRSGKGLLMLLLGEFKVAEAVEFLLENLDQEFYIVAMRALGNYKQERFRPIFEKYLEDQEPYAREIARKAIKKLDKVKEKKLKNKEK